MSIGVTLGLAVFPSLLLVRYFQERDLYPEPPRIIWTTFFLGALTTLPVLIVTLPFFSVLNTIASPYTYGFVSAFFFAAIPEEFFKLMVLLGFSFRQRDFDEPMDGIVYGAVVGQGFAALENVLYSLSGGSGLAILRAFTAVPAHACMGIIMGYFIGRARFEPERRVRLIVMGYLFAVMVHGLYDFPMMVTNGLQQMFGSIPDEYLDVALACLITSAAVLIISIVLGIRLVRAAHNAQVALSQPPPIPLIGGTSAAAPAVAHIEPAMADTVTIGRTANVPPPIPPHVPIRHASFAMVWAIIRSVFGAILAIVGGTVLSGGTHALLDDRNSGAAGGMLFAIIFAGIVPLAAGVRVFRKGIRDLNVAHRQKALS